MKINATLTTKSGRWTGIRKHVNRQYIHDSNDKSIDKSRTKYNYTGCEINPKKLFRRQYIPWLKKRNAKCRANGERYRCKSFNEFKAKKKLTNLGIATFGTISDKRLDLDLINKAYTNASSGQVESRYYRAVAWGLKHYVTHWNSRNHDVKLCHYAVNCDEAGAPHVHFEIVPLGFTKKGKPSSSLTNAVKRQYNTRNRKEAFKEWNKQETTALVKAVGSVMARRFSKVPQFQQFYLHHTGRAHSLSMETYKETHDYFRKQRRLLLQNKVEFKRKRFYEHCFDEHYLRYQKELALDKRKRIAKRSARLKRINNDLKANNHVLYLQNYELSKNIAKIRPIYQGLLSSIDDLLKHGFNYFKRVAKSIKTKAYASKNSVRHALSKPIRSVNDSYLTSLSKYRIKAHSNRERIHNNTPDL